MLLPGEMTVVRNRLVQWFDRLLIYPQVVGEFDDSALMKAFGRSGTGVFIAPTSIAAEVEKQYGVVAIGQTDEVLDRFFAISVERKISHPAAAAITPNLLLKLSLSPFPPFNIPGLLKADLYSSDH